MSPLETTEERTLRVIAGVRRPNFEYNGSFRVYGISHPEKKTVRPSSDMESNKQKPYNKTLIISDVSEGYANRIMSKEKANGSYSSVGVENSTGMPPDQHNK